MALTADEQTEGFQRIRDLRVREEAGGESAASRFVASMQKVADVLGHSPTVGEYKEVQPELAAAGEPVETFARVYRHYGTWPRALEALELAPTTPASLIEARFRCRRVGKVWRYTEGTMRDAIVRATEHWGRPPSVAEYEWWRERELELARNTGEEEPHLPSSNPFRKRWGTWEAALLHFGYTPEAVALRLEGKIQPHNRQADPYLPDGMPVAELDEPAGIALPLAPAEALRMVAAYRALARRSRYVLTVRLGLAGAEPVSLRAAGEPLALSLDRIRQIQMHAIDALAAAAAGDARNRPEPRSLRDRVIETLKTLAA
ncbi:MAG: hypothetical protein ABSG64_04550 [Solirubrobacteraceae bacterium]